MITVALSSTTASRAREHVILLHGLCRSSRSMAPMAAALCEAGYGVVNCDYLSRSASIASLSERAIGEALTTCRQQGATGIHFVTHSMGGILVRSYLSRHEVPGLGRIVMLAPPNQGSEIVDTFGPWTLFSRLHGPAGRELGTGPESTPNRLGPVRGCVGVIAGNRSINWINSGLMSGPDDGKVSVARTQVAGMADHRVISATHPFIMRNREAIRQTIHFLRDGAFGRRLGPASGVRGAGNA